MELQRQHAQQHCGLSYQSSPSYKPSPRIEMAPWTCQLLFFSWPKPKASHTSAVVKAPFCTQSHQSHALAGAQGNAGVLSCPGPAIMQAHDFAQWTTAVHRCHMHSTFSVLSGPVKSRDKLTACCAHQILFVGKDKDSTVPHKWVIHDSL